MSNKISLFLIAALGVVVFLGIKSFFSQIEYLSQVRQADFSKQELILAGKEESLILESTAFLNGDFIPQEYTCDGADINPRLEISNVPEKTKSLVLIFDDIDAVGGPWNHWLVWNISPDTETIGFRSIPKGARVGMNDFGEFGYSGPCPPSGEHRYMFQIYALDKDVSLQSSASRGQLEAEMENHVIAKTGLMGRYYRED